MDLPELQHCSVALGGTRSTHSGRVTDRVAFFFLERGWLPSPPTMFQVKGLRFMTWEGQHSRVNMCQSSYTDESLFQPWIKSTKRSWQFLHLPHPSLSLVLAVQDLGIEHREPVGGLLCIEDGGQGLPTKSMYTGTYTQEGACPSIFSLLVFQ